MKGNLHTRPLFVRTKEHSHARILICLIALIVVRIIQNKIVKFKVKIQIKIEKWDYLVKDQ